MSTVKYQITKARLDGANRKPRSSHRVNILFDGAESPAPGLLSSVVLPGGRQFINSEVDDSQTMPDFHFVGTAVPARYRATAAQPAWLAAILVLSAYIISCNKQPRLLEYKNHD